VEADNDPVSVAVRVFAMSVQRSAGSASIAQPDYWWYRARSNLLRTVLESFVHEPRLLLDVGSADGPSVEWLRGRGKQVALDVDPSGLSAGGVCGSALKLPFADATFDVVAAFDVVEHCEPEAEVLEELRRVLVPSGRLFISVPAYQWAWTRFDELSGHYRRYTRKRIVRAVEAAGLTVERSTYAFMSPFPLFALDRLASRLRHAGRAGDTGPQGEPATPTLPQVSPAAERVLMGLSRIDQELLRRANLPFGSSVIVVATKPT
jgi:SAM-dependent methyltransferase